MNFNGIKPSFGEVSYLVTQLTINSQSRVFQLGVTFISLSSLFVLIEVLGVEPRTLCVLRICSAAELYPSPCYLV